MAEVFCNASVAVLHPRPVQRGGQVVVVNHVQLAACEHASMRGRCGGHASMRGRCGVSLLQASAHLTAAVSPAPPTHPTPLSPLFPHSLLPSHLGP